MFIDEADFSARTKEPIAKGKFRGSTFLLGAILVAAVVVIPVLSGFKIYPFQNDYLLKAILIPFLILSLAAVGLNILTGYCGQISLGSAAFMAIGAYTAFNLAVRISWLPFPIVLFLAGSMSALVGFLFGLPSLRIKGLYLAVATLAAQFFVDWLFLRVSWFSNNESSGTAIAPRVKVLGWEITSPISTYLFILGSVAVIVAIVRNLTASDIGRRWIAVRDMDIAAEIIGISPLRAKLAAFTVSSFVIGVAGALWAFLHLGSWEPLAFGIDLSLHILFIVIIGGLSSLIGSFVGAAFLIVLPVALEQAPALFGIHPPVEVVSNIVTILLGLLIILILNFEPQGIVGLAPRICRALRLKMSERQSPPTT